MKRNIVLSLLVALVIFSGCEDDFLDRSIKTKQTYEDILNGDIRNLKGNGMAAYTYLREWTAYGSNAMLAAACDEADMVAKGAPIQKFNTGGWNQFSNPDEVLAWYYRGIVQTHNFIKNSVNYVDLLAIDTLNLAAKEEYLKNCDEIKKLRAENHFLRAYFYFELIKRYGGVPILEEPLAVDETNLPPRNTFDECVDYILQECDVAYNDMVDYWVNYGMPDGASSVIGSGRGDVSGSTDMSELGRAEKVAVKALKLRVLLYAASPLFNPTEDISKWEAAAAAGQDFLTDPELDWWKYLNPDYGSMFYMEDKQLLTSRKGSNSGIIFTVPSTIDGFQSTAFEEWNYPVGVTGGGKNVTAPSQNLVDAFEMTNGLSITDAFSGYDPTNPYENRDPRLKMIVGVNGDIFGKSVGGTDRPIQSYSGGPDAIGAKEGATTTGYYLKKMVNPDFDLSTAAGSQKSFILMRYAEVLLNFSEAMNEAYGPSNKPSIGGSAAVYSAVESINLVRGRAGMPPILNGISQEDLREKIRNERRVELAFEEHRFFDVRRWKIAEDTENMPLMGMRVIPDSSDTTAFSYEKFEVEQRVFDKNKMYLYPIPEAQIIINGWDQNPGW